MKMDRHWINNKKFLHVFFNQIILVIIALTLSIIVINLLEGITTSLYMFILSILFAISFTPLFITLTMRRKKIDIYEPIYLVLIMIFFSYYIRAYGLYRGGISSYLDSHLSWAVNSTFNQALGLVGLALLSFQVGYYLPFPYYQVSSGYRSFSTCQDIKVHLLNLKLRNLTLVFTFISLISFILIIKQVGNLFQAIMNRLTYFQGLGYLVILTTSAGIVNMVWIILAIMYKWKHYWHLRILLFFIFSIIILALGSRARLANIILIISAAWFYYSRSSFKIVKIIFLMVFILFLLTIFTEFRGSLNVVLSVEKTINIYKKGPLNIILKASTRTPEFDSLTNILQGVPHQVPFQYGATYLAILTAPVPRRLFPSKLKGCGEIFNETFLPDVYKEGKGSGIRPSIIGELYMNFGYIGVLLGMFFFGVFLKYLYLKFRGYLLCGPPDNYKAMKSVFIYLIVICHIPQLVRGEFMGTMISVINFSFFTLITLKIAHLVKVKKHLEKIR